jgi:ankyrin repeat/BTB/POZ domain-containing protein 1
MDAGMLLPPTKGFINNWDLHTSAKAGDILRVKYLVEQLDVDVNERDIHDSSPLFYACLCGHVDIVKFLIDCGSRLIPGLFETERCFYGALTSEIRKILEEHKADPNKFDHLGQNMQGLRSLALHSDFRLTVESTGAKGVNTKTFDLHRFILSMRSPWFASMFETDWKGQGNVMVAVDANTPFRSIAVASAMLDFIYTSQIDIDEDDAHSFAEALRQLEFLGAAKALQTEAEKKDRELRSIVLKLEKERNRLAADIGSAFHALDLQNMDGGIQNALEQLNARAWHDICLEVQNSSGESNFFACHRALLSQHSAYFHTMINGQFMEAKALRSSDASLPLLTLSETKRTDLFCIALRFLYTNRLHENLREADSIELLKLSDRLLLMELKRLCAVRLRKDLNQGNVFELLRLGDTFSIRLLRQASLDFIEQHIKDLYQTEAFQRALEEHSEEIVQELRLYITDKIEDVSST